MGNIEINSDLFFIKYNTAPSDYLRDLDPDEYLKLRDRSLEDGNHIARAVTISAMISSQASILMNPFLNMKNNPSYYTDTEFCILK